MLRKCNELKNSDVVKSPTRVTEGASREEEPVRTVVSDTIDMCRMEQNANEANGARFIHDAGP